MSGLEKKGLFGRLFGGAKKPSAEPVVEAVTKVVAEAVIKPLTEPEAEIKKDEIAATEIVVSEDVAVADVDGDISGVEATVEATAEVQIEVEETPVVEDMPEPIVEAIAEPEPQDELPDEVERHDEKEPVKKGWFSRLKSGLSKSSSKLSEGITGIFTKRKLDDEALEELEDLLIQSDLGVAMAMRITERLSSSRYDKEISDVEVRSVLAEEVVTILQPVAKPLELVGGHKPHILLMVGVNGAGKTTTIGKLAHKFHHEGKSVMMAAGDTFRAAAIDQLKVWADRTGAAVVARDVGSDASGLVFDALAEAREQGVDVLMIDTAGRLQNKTDLMAELEKIVRVIKKFDPTGPHDVLLTLDATTGQNALNQVEVFGQIAGVTGLIMTKLDGSARGGILVAIADKFQLPIHAIGVGEGVEDMQAFDPLDFANAIADVNS